MPRHDSPQGNILEGLGQILVGVGMLAVAAGETLAGLRQGPKPDMQPGAGSLADIMKSRPHPRRKPPESGLPAPAVPPRGPVPLQGGAAARLDFEA
jgi:hypothetical protein